MLQEKGGIIGPGGKYGRMDKPGTAPIGDNWRLMVFDGNNDQGDYEFTLTEVSPGRGQAVDTTTGSYTGVDITAFGGDLHKCAYGKPSDPAGYETFYMYGPVAAGVKFLFVQYDPAPGSNLPPYGGSILTWVPRK